METAMTYHHEYYLRARQQDLIREAERDRHARSARRTRSRSSWLHLTRRSTRP
jgi:hypothetical protein